MPTKKNGPVELSTAIDNHDLSRVLELLSSGVDANAKMPHLNALPLHAAIHEVSDGAPLDLVAHLIAFGADINVPDEFGTFPLGIALSEGNRELVDILLEAGADPNARSGDGELPLHLAVESGDVELCRALLKHGATESMNDWSATSGLTPLGYAARQLNISVVELLRSNGALLAAQDDDLKTARQRLPVREEENLDAWEKVAKLLE